METTRRSFLGGLAVATALSSAAAAQAVTSTVAESQELLELGKLFDATFAKYQTFADALPAIQQAYLSIAPEMPADLISRHGYYAWRHGFTDFMADPSGCNDEVFRDENGSKLHVVHSYLIETRYGAKCGKKPVPHDFSEASEIDVRLHGIAQQYEQAVDQALTTSGLKEALSAYNGVKYTLRQLIWDICAIRANTPAGVALKVRATGAYASFGTEERMTASQLLARAIWEDMGEAA